MSLTATFAIMAVLMIGMLLIAYAAHALKEWAGWLGAALIVAVLIVLWFL